MTPRQILELVTELFPYDQWMPPEFKGHHSLVIDRETGHLNLWVWANDRCHQVGFETADDESDGPALHAFLLDMRAQLAEQREAHT